MHYRDALAAYIPNTMSGAVSFQQQCAQLPCKSMRTSQRQLLVFSITFLCFCVVHTAKGYKCADASREKQSIYDGYLKKDCNSV